MEDNNTLQISYSLGSIEQAVHRFWQYAHGFRIIAFDGAMGAGKTTFCSALARHIGVAEQLSSPTFALMQEYEIQQGKFKIQNSKFKIDESKSPTLLMHMDWYRLRDEEEAIAAGVENILEDARYRCWIEWPEKAAALLPRPYLQVYISIGHAFDERIVTWKEVNSNPCP